VSPSDENQPKFNSSTRSYPSERKNASKSARALRPLICLDGILISSIIWSDGNETVKMLQVDLMHGLDKTIRFFRNELARLNEQKEL
jgi:hypothetical protein